MIGQVVAQYEILERLGGGGMGVVYRARDTKLERFVALKFLPEELAEDREALERFQREARAASALNHPHICTIHDLGEDRGVPFLVMELLQGRTLKYEISARPMAIERILELGAQAADALGAAHAAGIVHRDVKPANLFVTARGDLKVLDFGLAKVTAADGPMARGTAAGDPHTTTELAPADLTAPGSVMGTIAYMSPEQVRGEVVDSRSDLFSLGAVLYEMATGRPAFPGATQGVVFSRILEHDPPPAVRADSDLPDGLGRILEKALAKDKTLRYQHAAELQTDLRRLAAETTGAMRSSGARSGASGSPSRAASVKNRWVGLVGIAAAIALALALWLGRGETPTTGSADRPTGSASVAVLPFVNMSDDEGNEYFADGLSEELLNSRAQIPQLKVAGRTSSFQFKGKTEDLRTIGEKLDVASLLEGSVRKAGNRVRITAQLVDAADGFHLWSSTFDRELEDVFAIQEEIAREVASALELTLLPETARRLERRPTENLDAYNVYLQGRQLLARRSGEAIEAAAGLFETAVELDPEFALAWVGLADAEYLLAEYAGTPRAAARASAKAAVDRALALDGRLGDAYATLGALLAIEREFDAAERAFERALELSPSSPKAHHWYEVLLFYGRREASEKSLALIERAVELDPLAPVLRENLAQELAYQGRFEEAIAQLDTAISLDPAFAGGYSGRAFVAAMTGRHDESVRWLSEAAKRDPANPYHQLNLGFAYLSLGDLAAAEETARRLERDAPGSEAASAVRLLVHLAREEWTEAEPLALRLVEDDPEYLWATRVIDLRAGRAHEARERYEERVPELLHADPVVDTANVKWALDLVSILRRTGEIERADRLLRESGAVIESLPDRTRGVLHHFDSARLHALEGEPRLALGLLEAGVDVATIYWWTIIQLEPDLAAVREDPEFASLEAEVNRRQAVMRKRLEDANDA